MLQLALEAQLPLVAVSTRDTLNLSEVVHELTKKNLVTFNVNGPHTKNTIYQFQFPPGKNVEMPYETVYSAMTKLESTLVLVNPPKVLDIMFDAGEVPVPRKLMMGFLKAVVVHEKKAEELIRGLGGCTIREAAELCRLTMARDSSLTVAGLMETRKSAFMGQKGLSQVDVQQGFYEAPSELVVWVKKEKKFFLTSPDFRLRPRGLLFDGKPGTGKTAGSKWIAEQFGVPLYRMDIGGTKGRYVGDSETALLSHFSRLDAQEPAVCLIDEIEKVFVDQHDGGTTTSMLSQLLWWLAEHKSRVLTIMTTNAADKLPKELHREGRIDKTMVFEGVPYEHGPAFIGAVLKTFPDFKWHENDAEAIRKKVYGKLSMGTVSKTASQASLTEATYQFIKQSAMQSSCN